MQLGLMLGYAVKKMELPIDLIKGAEQLGYDSVWVAETWGSDAVSVAAWILAQTNRLKVGTAIMQVPARTPANTAMSAMSLAQLSNGRFILGLGASGPQVVEGWHGVGYQRALTRLRECIEIVRLIMAREEPAQYDGEIYQIPYRGEGATGLGKPLKSILQADTSIPIYTASFTPAGFRLSGEIADGFFPAFMSPEKMDFILSELEKGFAKAGGGKSYADFDIAACVGVAMGDDLDACRLPIKKMLALYIGGMGAKKKNFYNDFAVKMGYADAAAQLQELYLGGKQREAIQAVPDELVDEVALVGPAERIAERAQAWKAKSEYIKTMLFSVHQPEVLPVLKKVFSD
jgi:F420-dependent oxidoreductase-like protein